MRGCDSKDKAEVVHPLIFLMLEERVEAQRPLLPENEDLVAYFFASE